ncbi:MAG: ArsA family ATPase [Mycobacteriaceae bacterium]
MSPKSSASIRFFIGKGGVGKTTLAAASALARSCSGQRVLIVSMDQAHSLGDAFAIAMAGGAGESSLVELSDNLDGLALDTLALAEQQWSRGLQFFATNAGHQHGLEFGGLAPEELMVIPGVQELLGLDYVSKLAASGRWDEIVVDCAPTAEVLRMLTLPDALLTYMERLWPRHRRLVAAVSGDARLALMVGLIERVCSSAERLREVLGNGQLVGATLVLTPEKVVVAEAVRTITALSLLGIQLDAVIVNRTLAETVGIPDSQLGGHPAILWYEQRLREQRQVVGSLAHVLERTPLQIVEFLSSEPTGLGALKSIAESCYGTNSYKKNFRENNVRDDEDNEIMRQPETGVIGLTALPEVSLESGTGSSSIYVLRLDLPFIDPSTLSLGRVEDDLVIGAQGVRRRIRLASVLRRCHVVGAELDGSKLTVRFTPNLEVWPQ